MILKSFLLSIFVSASVAFGEPSVPYLGPGTDQLTPEQYKKTYRDYIQESVLLGYPFLKEAGAPCDHALRAIFRQVGMFSYPVPADAPEVRRKSFKSGTNVVELYSLGGVVIQVVRKNQALQHLLLANATTTKSRTRVLRAAERSLLRLTRDKATGLERLSGVPVGYPHHFLTADSQGLYVRILTFNGRVDSCRPVAFTDNSWIGGFSLDEQRCGALQADVENVWLGKLAPQEFSHRALEAMKLDARRSAKKNGATDQEADEAITRNFAPPFTNTVNIVGLAMRNLAQCNQLALTSSPLAAPSPGEGNGRGAGSAK